MPSFVESFGSGSQWGISVLVSSISLNTLPDMTLPQVQVISSTTVVKHAKLWSSLVHLDLSYVDPFKLQYPTKALAPLMLEDYRKVLVDKKGEQELFSMSQIQQCMRKGMLISTQICVHATQCRCTLDSYICHNYLDVLRDVSAFLKRGV